jgi:hypothetical protein
MRTTRLTPARTLLGCSIAALAFAGTAWGATGPAKNPDPQEQALRFVKCMRAHGVNLPDPGPNGFIRVGGPNGRTRGPVQTPQFKKAQKACAKYAPQGTLSPAKRQELQERFLEFARCMRENGVPNFPDPKFDQGGGFLIGGPGLNPNSPAVRKAREACEKLLPTPAPGP